MTMPRADRPASRGGAIPEHVRRISRRPVCGVCGVGYGGGVVTEDCHIWVPRENLDHVVPVRWCRQHGYEPNVPENILSVCHRCNLKKKGAEDALFGGDPYKFVKLLDAMGWAPHLERTFRHYDMRMMLGVLQRA